jgi:hypothetical protein
MVRVRLCLAVLCATAVAAFVSGCAEISPRSPVPQALAGEASVPGLAHVRFWGDQAPKDIIAAFKRTMPSLSRLAESPPENGRPIVNYLAISSGGDDGAFAAGLLVGWTKSGRRPRFEIVTGVSAGALIAPFAFLGPSYDRELTAIWTRYDTDDLVVKQPLAALLGGSALADTQPLADLIAHYVDHRLLAAIAKEYRKGRLLLIGTTNLDAQRPVVWNMGEIALSADPRALTLFRQVMLASVSIPVAFPPVRIEVEARGVVHDELHVDGGTTRKVFIAPLQLSLRSLDPLYSAPPLHRFYIIANTKLAPEWKPAEANVFAIAQSSLAAISKSQGVGDLFRLYLLAKRDGADFNLAAIPEQFSLQSKQPFDRQYMQALFEAGMARGGRRWLKQPPELDQNPG